MNEPKKLSGVETIKIESEHLKGQIAQELADTSTNDVSDATYELLKFHGSYFGYDRDSATTRKKAGLEKEFEFMVRMKCPGGRLTAEQYLGLDTIVDKYANGTLRITTRETFQFHCIKKVGMKPLIGDLNRLLLSTLGGCGDVVRNIMMCPAPIKDAVHAKLEADGYLLAKYCAPKTSSYWEIWLDGEKMVEYPFAPDPVKEGEVAEPLYGDTYMPRKFKIALTVPEDNCTDALTNDIAIVSLFEGDTHVGYNFYLGGGLGMKHNSPKTYARIATPTMFVPPEMLIAAVDAVIKLQRDHGDRTVRQHARLKYLVQEKGTPWIKETIEGYLGQKMEDVRPQNAYAVEDHTGWHEQGDGKWFLGVPVSSGRIVDRGEEKIRTGLRDVISEYKMPLVLTADQNVILCDIAPEDKAIIDGKLRAYGIKLREDITPVYRHMIACVSYPTCGKALAEAERIKLPLLSEIETVMRRQEVIDERIAIRIAGCPNGCSRPYVGDIGIVGRMPDNYALFIGGDFEGTRLNEKVFDKVPYEGVAATLEPMFALWKQKKNADEGFGDFCYRYGIAKFMEEVKPALAGKDWVK